MVATVAARRSHVLSTSRSAQLRMRSRCSLERVRPRASRTSSTSAAFSAARPSARPFSKERRCESLRNLSPWGCISKAFLAASPRAVSMKAEYSIRCSSEICSMAAAAARATARAVCGSPRPWAMTLSTASSGSRRARSMSVMMGIPSGPTTSGAQNQLPPSSMRWDAHRAVAASGVTTTSTNGHSKRARALKVYTGHVKRLRASSWSCASMMMPKTGLPSTAARRHRRGTRWERAR